MDPIVTTAEMRELDRQAIDELGIPSHTLMEVAGREVARECARYLKKASHVVVVCGAGSNGGDGFVTARALMARGHHVRVFIFADRKRIKTDAAATLASLEKTDDALIVFVIDESGLKEFKHALSGAALIVDALFGVGLHEDVRGIIAEAMVAINATARPVVSVDIPSGVDANTGAILGQSIQATSTVTFGFAKRGHYLFPGAQACGALRVVDIGIPRALATRLGVLGRVIKRHDGPRLLAARSPDAHKGDFGHVVVVAGSDEKPGAGLLCLQGALRSGTGLVSWAVDEGTLLRASVRPPEVMLRVRTEREPDTWAAKILAGATAVVMGPGTSTSPERRNELLAILRRARVPICLDADALTMLASDASLWEHVQAPLVVTPHPKEMARLLSSVVSEVQRDRFLAATTLSVDRNCVVVLKGAGTVVAEPDGIATVVAAGNVGLASGGTGDVLAGIIGGLLAQGLEPGAAARAGVLLHGVAADTAIEEVGQGGLIASDVARAVGTVYKEWHR